MSFPAAGIDVVVQFYRSLNLKFCFVLGFLYDNEYKTKEDEN